MGFFWVFSAAIRQAQERWVLSFICRTCFLLRCPMFRKNWPPLHPSCRPTSCMSLFNPYCWKTAGWRTWLLIGSIYFFWDRWCFIFPTYWWKDAGWCDFRPAMGAYGNFNLICRLISPVFLGWPCITVHQRVWIAWVTYWYIKLIFIYQQNLWKTLLICTENHP